MPAILDLENLRLFFCFGHVLDNGGLKVVELRPVRKANEILPAATLLHQADVHKDALTGVRLGSVFLLELPRLVF